MRSVESRRKTGKKRFDINDIRHENIRSNMLIAIIRYANNKRHFIIFDLSCTTISSPLESARSGLCALLGSIAITSSLLRLDSK
jgi:hypothetical protein